MVSSDFLGRVSGYPVVSSACQLVTAGVAWAQDRSVLARTAAGIAESGLRRVADASGPLLTACGGRIAELDRLACRQLLDRLEAACPTVLQPADKVAERGLGYYSEAVKPKVEFVLSPVTAAAAKFQSAKSAGLQRYRQAVGSRQGQAGLRQFDQLIQLLSDCLDKCAPPPPPPPATAELEEEKARRADETADDEECKEAGGVEMAPAEEAPADPARSLALAYGLGREVSISVADRVATAGHRLADRLLGRSASAASSAAAATSESSDPSTPPPPPADEAGADSDEAEESQLDCCDLSAD